MICLLCCAALLLLISSGPLAAWAEMIAEQRADLEKTTDEDERIDRLSNLRYALLGEDPEEAAA